MSSDLADKFLKACEFDEKAAEKTRFERGVNSLFGQNKDTGKRCEILFTDGAKWEVDRRQPIDLAVAECLRAIEPLVIYCVDWNHGTHAKIYRPKIVTALENLERVLSEAGG